MSYNIYVKEQFREYYRFLWNLILIEMDQKYIFLGPSLWEQKILHSLRYIII